MTNQARTPLRTAYAKRLLRRHVQKQYNSTHGLPEDTPLPPTPILPSHPPGEQEGPNGQVCIIGAGVTGLQIALALQACGVTDVDILESSDRVGGRCYTYRFPEQDCPHDYYDVGAMRFSDMEANASVFNMINYLGLGNAGRLKDPSGILRKYTYAAGNEPNMYNYSSSVAASNTAFVQLMEKYVEYARDNFDKAYDDLDGYWDRYSTRDFLLANHHLPEDQPWSHQQILEAETFDTSTGLFDQAFSEFVCDYDDLQHAKDAKANWYRIEGGVSVLPNAMHARILENNKQRGCSVRIKMSTPVQSLIDNGKTITVGANGKLFEYAAVFNTTSLGCLQRMDLSGLNLQNLGHAPSLATSPLTSIRTLTYDHGTKVAIKFTQPWWTTWPTNKNHCIFEGGASSCDLPIRKVVYPSWNDGPETSHVLIVSYTRSQDATRMASLVQPSSTYGKPNSSDPLVTLCLRNLAQLWSHTPGAPTFSDLLDMYANHHAFAWATDPSTTGAFASFGPGDFASTYLAFARPLCDGKLSICGEAVSATHKWIAGAMDSGYRAVWNWFCANKWPGLVEKLEATPFARGEGRNTLEMETDVLTWLNHLDM